MKTLDELGISPAPWFARLGVMEGDFVNSESEDNEDGEVCAVSLHDFNLIQSHANARLIASAPELYECLRNALKIMSAMCTGSGDCKNCHGVGTCEKWYKALEKAGGDE